MIESEAAADANSTDQRAFLEDPLRSWATDSSSSSATRYLSWWLRRRTVLAWRKKSMGDRRWAEEGLTLSCRGFASEERGQWGFI